MGAVGESFNPGDGRYRYGFQRNGVNASKLEYVTDHHAPGSRLVETSRWREIRLAIDAAGAVAFLAYRSSKVGGVRTGLAPNGVGLCS